MRDMECDITSLRHIYRIGLHLRLHGALKIFSAHAQMHLPTHQNMTDKLASITKFRFQRRCQPNKL